MEAARQEAVHKAAEVATLECRVAQLEAEGGDGVRERRRLSRFRCTKFVFL